MPPPGFASPLLIENSVAYGSGFKLGGGTISRSPTAGPPPPGPATVPKGNSWELGGTWNASSALSADPAPQFLVPRSGAHTGARF
ncbi:hypothetical protein [Streptomyces sp. NPDC001492]